ncbi:TBC1 domain family member 3D isoform X2 [Oryctolagus cuniculus]|uniref:TBC1 domain family member 3D isoform X2 n=1 Tax=Oryctolagus cuniculus TaxID=9986 RepID=UPI003879D2EB
MDTQRRLDMDALRSGRAQERAAIILKYEQGPRKWPQFHLGEEDDESGALVPDKLGFLCKQKPPRHGCLAVQWRKHQEGRRLQKWNKMLRNFTKYRSSEKFHRRIEKGIPAQVRGKVWAMMLSVDTRKAQNPGKFEEMKERARLCSDQVQQIDEDVARTFRSHIMFRERYGAKQRSLFEVLLAYSMYNPELGYSQGLSHVAALLLMWLSEEDAFWALVQLMGDSQHAMHDFYTPDSPKLERFQHHLGAIMRRVLPSLEKHLEKEGVCLEDYTAHWYIQCFLDGVPFPLALRMFDIYILEGAHVLTGMVYTVLKVHRKRLMKMSRDHIREFLQVTLKQAWSLSEDAVIRQLRASMRELGKLQCLLPPEDKPTEDGSPALQVPPGSQERAPPPVSIKTIVAESKGCHPAAAAPQEPAGASASVPGETGPLGSAVQPDSKQHTKEEKGSRGKSSTQPRGQGSSTGASGSGGAAHLSGPQCSWLDEPGPLRRWTSLTKLNVTFQDDSDSEDEEYYSGLEKQEEDEEEEEGEEDQAAECPASPWPKLLRDLRFVLPETIFEEDEEGGCEEGASPEPSSPALSVKSSESLRGPGLLAPQSLQSRGDLSRWGGLPNLSPPVKGADFWPLELGGQQGLRAPPPPASEPLDPGPMQAVPALGAGLKMPSLHGSPMHSGDTHGLEPAGASSALGDQACVPSLARGLLAAHSMEELDVCGHLEGKNSPPGVQLRRARSLGCLSTAASPMDKAPLWSSSPPS